MIFISLILNFATPDLRIFSFTFFFCALVSVIVIEFSVTVTLFFAAFLAGFPDFVAIIMQDFDSVSFCQVRSIATLQTRTLKIPTDSNPCV